MVKNNVACRIFSEQLNLINQLPEKERANVLYAVINTVFSDFEQQNSNQIDDQIDDQIANQIANQIDNQIDRQIDKQNANTYISISTSISKSISKMSVLSKTVYELLCKNIVVKEYSNNYGGVRDSRKKAKVEKEKPEHKIETVAKKSYGEFKTVKLTDEEYQKLKQNYTECHKDAFEKGIEILDRYLASKGKQYKSHYAVMKQGGWVWREAMKQAKEDEVYI